MKLSNWLAVAILALTASAASATTINRVTNGGFDDPTAGSLAGWHKTVVGRFIGTGLSISRKYYAYSYNSSTFSAGNFISLSQDVDLTGVDNVSFSIKLGAGTGLDFSNFIVEMLVGTDSLWSADTEGSRHPSVDVSAYSGVQTLSWRLMTTASGTYGTRSFLLDNVEALAEVTEAVPLPPTALMVLSCLAVIGIRRRKPLR